jgi:hypothetical protein
LKERKIIMKRIQTIIYICALAVAVAIASAGDQLVALILLSIVGAALSRPKARCCAVTLSVPELLADVLEAFKLELPEIFEPGGFARDFSSDTARLGDTITAHLSHVPVTGAYDPNNGGFKNAVQDVTTLIEDVQVTLNEMPVCTVRQAWLSRTASKLDPYKSAVKNLGFGLAKGIWDGVLSRAAVHCSNSMPLAPVLFNLDALDGPVRERCNAQKMTTSNRMLFVSTPLASALGADDRVRSSLFLGQKIEATGFRVWRNVGGFREIREYPDIVNAGVSGLALDPRLVGLAIRKLRTQQDAADQLGVPRVMDFHSTRESQTGLELTAVDWQEGGTGDVFFSVAVLLGKRVGNGGGAPGSGTDNAGLLITT